MPIELEKITYPYHLPFGTVNVGNREFKFKVLTKN